MKTVFFCVSFPQRRKKRGTYLVHLLPPLDPRDGNCWWFQQSNFFFNLGHGHCFQNYHNYNDPHKYHRDDYPRQLARRVPDFSPTCWPSPRSSWSSPPSPSPSSWLSKLFRWIRMMTSFKTNHLIWHATHVVIGSGVGEGGYLQTWTITIWRRSRSRCLLHHPLRRHLREDRHEDRHLRDPPARDSHQGQRHRLCQRHHVLQGEAEDCMLTPPQKL